MCISLQFSTWLGVIRLRNGWGVALVGCGVIGECVVGLDFLSSYLEATIVNQINGIHNARMD